MVDMPRNIIAELQWATSPEEIEQLMAEGWRP
jgi:hypothetical protein